MFLVPLALAHGAAGVTPAGLVADLVPVTPGDRVGGGVLAGLCYRPPATVATQD